MGEHGSQFRVLSFDLEERDALARQVTLLSDALTNLERALEHSRDIGVAMGILMSSEHVSRECAWDMLRMVSQCQNRKLYLVAAEVAQTGELPLTRKPPVRGEAD
jgi:AmiR/NasT family two-component response regulator